MGLKDLTGVFSRHFVQGFFAPAFFALILLKLGLDEKVVPDAVEGNSSGPILVLAGAAVLLGLLLLGIHRTVLWLLSGEPLRGLGLGFGAERPAQDHGPLDPDARQHRKLGRQLAQFDRLTKESTADDDSVRGPALVALDRSFPSERSRVKPLRFGNVAEATVSYVASRWHLDSTVVWPRIEALLSPQENALHTDAASNLAFLVNSCLGSTLVGLALWLDGFAFRFHHPDWTWLYLLPVYFVAPFVAAYLLYVAAVSALGAWQVRIRASVDLHRLELYDLLGVRRPMGPFEEKRLAEAINQLLVYGKPSLRVSARARSSTRD